MKRTLSLLISTVLMANLLSMAALADDDLIQPRDSGLDTFPVSIAAPSNGTLSVTDGGIPIASGDEIAENTELTVSATPDTGYSFDSITVNGSDYTSNSINLTVTQATSISAQFSEIPAPSSSTGLVYEPLSILDDDGNTLESNSGNAFLAGSVASDGSVALDGIAPGQTFYIKLGELGDDRTTTLSCGSHNADASQLVDDDLFKISIDKDGTGKSLISSITQVSEKNLDGTRSSFLKVVLKDSTTTDDLKATAEITFKAKNTLSASGNNWDSGDYAVLNLTMWINNTSVDGDGSAETGDRIYIKPTANEENSFIWGDDRAALTFYADDDADAFYARLSTKADVDVYTEYGDPVNAELYFYDFVGNPSVPSTSRAALTLGIPWEDDEYDPETCYIYQLDSDGTLTDLTDQFAYSEDSYEISGWTIMTRTLGTYVVSDTELDVETYTVDTGDDSDETYEEVVTLPTTGGGSDYNPYLQTAAAGNYNMLADTTASSEIEEESVSEPEVQQIDSTVTAEPISIDFTADVVETVPESDKKSSFPWFGIILGMACLAGAGAAGYFVYRRVENGR